MCRKELTERLERALVSLIFSDTDLLLQLLIDPEDYY